MRPPSVLGIFPTIPAAHPSRNRHDMIVDHHLARPAQKSTLLSLSCSATMEFLAQK